MAWPRPRSTWVPSSTAARRACRARLSCASIRRKSNEASPERPGDSSRGVLFRSSLARKTAARAAADGTTSARPSPVRPSALSGTERGVRAARVVVEYLGTRLDADAIPRHQRLRVHHARFRAAEGAVRPGHALGAEHREFRPVDFRPSAASSNAASTIAFKSVVIGRAESFVAGCLSAGAAAPGSNAAIAIESGRTIALRFITQSTPEAPPPSKAGHLRIEQIVRASVNVAGRTARDPLRRLGMRGCCSSFASRVTNTWSVADIQ